MEIEITSTQFESMKIQLSDDGFSKFMLTMTLIRLNLHPLHYTMHDENNIKAISFVVNK